jgi:hypothetical protein
MLPGNNNINKRFAIISMNGNTPFLLTLEEGPAFRRPWNGRKENGLLLLREAR